MPQSARPGTSRISRRKFLQGATAVPMLIRGVSVKGPAAAKPNIIFILIDDQSYFNLTCYGGNSFSQPNIDALAAKSIRFNCCFSSPVCSPSRSQLLTGCYGFRTGITNVQEVTPHTLDHAAFTTFPNLLQDHGYVNGLSGKWHLVAPAGAPDEAYHAHIQACGFASGNYMFYKTGTIKYWNGNVYAPDVHQAFALDFIEMHANGSKPFFLYYATGLPHFTFDHTPLNATGKDRDPANYPYMMQYLDAQIGAVVKKVRDLGIADNTYLFLAGDNGTDPRISVSYKGALIQGEKFKLTDAGIQVPCLVTGPGISGNRTTDALIDFCDFYPTITSLAGVSRIPDIDGKSFGSVLRDPSSRGARQWIYAQYDSEWVVRNHQRKYKSDGSFYDVTRTPFSESAITSPSAEDVATKSRLKTAGESLRSSVLRK